MMALPGTMVDSTFLELDERGTIMLVLTANRHRRATTLTVLRDGRIAELSTGRHPWWDEMVIHVEAP